MCLKWRKYAFFIFTLFLLFPLITHADVDIIDHPQNDEYFRAKVIEIIKDSDSETENPYQKIKAKPLHGTFEGQEIFVTQESIRNIRPIKQIKEGQTIVIYWSELNNPPFQLESLYRIPRVIHFIILFFAVVTVFTHIRGITSLLSLVLTFLLIIFFIVPQIAYGANPILISLIGSLAILTVSLFLSHGVNTRTTIAFMSSITTISLSVILGQLSIIHTRLSGTGTEEAFFLQLGNLDMIDLKGLLLGGIIIGTIGVLDDVTVVQASIVEEIHTVNPNLTKMELYKHGIKVGKEHIISMVNTLFIAYAGASLPLFLFFTYQNNASIPLWVKLNSDIVIEEVVRSVVGSLVLICAVPITTYIAAHIYSHMKKYEAQ